MTTKNGVTKEEAIKIMKDFCSPNPESLQESMTLANFYCAIHMGAEAIERLTKLERAIDRIKWEIWDTACEFDDGEWYIDQKTVQKIINENTDYKYQNERIDEE